MKFKYDNKMYKQNLTTNEAEEIISSVENILTKPKLKYGTYRLSDLNGFTRIDVANAFKLNIAEIYFSNNYNKENLDVLINAYGTSLINIATNGVPDFEIDKLDDKNDMMKLNLLKSKWSLIPLVESDNYYSPSIQEEQKLFGSLETISSFSKYCAELIQSNEPNYWHSIYSEIGLNYSINKPSTSEQVYSEKKQKENKSGCLKTIFIFLILSFIGIAVNL